MEKHKIVLFSDFGPDPDVQEFDTVEEARAARDSLTGYAGIHTHYIARIVEEKKINHG